ncbi:MAG: hypothetical protein WCP01_16700 [Methylococcaceae bacterium]
MLDWKSASPTYVAYVPATLKVSGSWSFRDWIPMIELSSLYTSIQVTVIPAGKRVSSARDVNFKYVPIAWIPAVHAGMTGFMSVCITMRDRVWE